MPGEADGSEHCRRLERMFRVAPVVAILRAELEVHPGGATLRMPAEARLQHAAGSLHGGIYAYAADNVLYFAASSLEPTWFLLTARLELDLLRPVTGGILTAAGTATEAQGRRRRADARLRDDAGRIIARARAELVASRRPLAEVPGYA